MSAESTDPRIEPFLYPDQAGPRSPWEDLGAQEETTAHTVPEPVPEPTPDLQAIIDETRLTAYVEGREQGMEEARKTERAAQAAAAAESNGRMELALDAFLEAREQFIQEFEPAVVRLALAIAGRILRREAHTDPLLLSGAVRVALGQLAASAEVRLRVPAAEVSLWEEWAAMLPNLRSKLVVEAAEGMRLGDCIVETDIGSADLGVRAQLGEIDRVFFENSVEVKIA
jgi:flagellar assembly protein FliH